MAKLEHLYANEMEYLAEAGREFARAHPQEAALLHPDNVQSRDPHVERLFESFAFLTATLRGKLDEELSELAHGLLDLLYPPFIRPIPALTTLQLTPDFAQMTKPARVDPGELAQSTPIEVGSQKSRVVCKFQTCYPVDLYPFELTAVKLTGPIDGKHRVDLSFALRGSARWAQLGMDRVRLLLGGGSFQLIYSLYYHLMHHVSRVELRGDAVETPVAGRVEPVGFLRGEEVLPYPIFTFPGFRLVQEYFCFPEKFLYVDLCGLAALGPAAVAAGFTIQIWLDGEAPGWWKLSRDNFQQFCTPAVNLYRAHVHPVPFDERTAEYRVVVDGKAPEAEQIHSVSSVSGLTKGQPSTSRIHYQSFLDFRHNNGEDEPYYSVSMRRDPAGCMDVRLTLAQPDGSASLLPEQSLSIEADVFNGHYVAELGPGDVCDRDTIPPIVKRLRNLATPSAVRWPRDDGAEMWRLVSHVGLSQLTLTDVDSLQALLRLLEWTGTDANQTRIRGLKAIEVVNPRALQIRQGVAYRGLELKASLDDRCFTDLGDAYLFALVLRHLLSLYVSINSFVRLRVVCTGANVEWVWPPVDGNQMPV